MKTQVKLAITSSPVIENLDQLSAPSAAATSSSSAKRGWKETVTWIYESTNLSVECWCRVLVLSVVVQLFSKIHSTSNRIRFKLSWSTLPCTLLASLELSHMHMLLFLVSSSALLLTTVLARAVTPSFLLPKRCSGNSFSRQRETSASPIVASCNGALSTARPLFGASGGKGYWNVVDVLRNLIVSYNSFDIAYTLIGHYNVDAHMLISPQHSI